MTDHVTPSDRTDDTEHDIDLSPEQVEALRKAMGSIAQRISESLKIPNARLNELAVNVLIPVAKATNAQNAIILDALKPVIEVQQQLAAANKDLLASQMVELSALSVVSDELTRNMNFGLSEFAANFGQSFARTFIEIQKSWLENLAPVLSSLAFPPLPPNLLGIEKLTSADVELVVMIDGIPLYGVPRTSTAEAILRAPDATRRREVLGENRAGISEDCRTALAGLSAKSIHRYIQFAETSLDALDNGHPEAAQALSSSLIEAILTEYFGAERHKYTSRKSEAGTKAAYEEFSARQFIAFASIWQAYQKFMPGEASNVPETYSRHATAHTVSRRQFNLSNSVQSILFACSLLYRLDEELANVAGETH